MDMNGISTDAGAGQDGALPHVAQHVRILLVDCDTTSLMSLASQFEQQLYKVTTTESAKVALALFQERSTYYDVVIADICMQEMPISEFVEKVHNQRMNVPIILTAEEYLTEDLAREAMANNVCYFMSKPPSHRDLLNVWIHVRRVTGEMPALSNMTNYFETENNDASRGGDMTNYIEMKNNEGSKGGAAGNQEQNNLHLKVDNTDRESVKRKKKQIAENPNSSNQAQEEDAHNAKKPRLSWTPYLDDKFLRAVNVLGEHGAQPQKILSLMNEPGLTARNIASHLQNYRKQRRQSSNLQKIGWPGMPAVLSAATLNSIAQGQTFGTASAAYVPAPDLVHYSFYGAKQDQDSFYNSGNSSADAIINNGVQVPKGNGEGSYSVNAITHDGVQVPKGNGEGSYIVNPIINDGVQVPKGNGEGSYIVDAIINDGVQVPKGNGEGSYIVDAIINDGVQVPKGNGGGRNSLEATTQEPEGASCRLSNGLKAPNQEPKGKFGPELPGYGNMGYMDSDNLGEGSGGSNQQFDVPSNDEINQFMQDMETSKVDTWDWVY